MYGHCTLECIVMRITCTFLWSFVYTRCGKLKGERTLKKNSVMSVKVESKNPNSANKKKLGKKNNSCDLMQTLFPYNGATVSFKHWPAGHSANNVADADLLSAVVLQVHSVPSEHKQSLTPFQDIIQEYLCQPNKTTAGKTVWLGWPHFAQSIQS